MSFEIDTQAGGLLTRSGVQRFGSLVLFVFESEVEAAFSEHSSGALSVAKLFRTLSNLRGYD